jgi:hypothetical protein
LTKSRQKDSSLDFSPEELVELFLPNLDRAITQPLEYFLGANSKLG